MGNKAPKGGGWRKMRSVDYEDYHTLPNNKIGRDLMKKVDRRTVRVNLNSPTMVVDTSIGYDIYADLSRDLKYKKGRR